ncbi:MAG: glycosyltransferase family 2 protein [Candidatus Promineofilum sp.]|nr:glycosyltransferase family 2 protein [Promineifilum sp.]
MRIDLIWIATDPISSPDWTLGRMQTTGPSPAAVAAAVKRLEPGAEAVLFWDAMWGAPDESAILAAARLPGDVRHAGLSLGLGGLPRMIDFVDPVWRFNRDPEPEIDATSWRLSLRACLVRVAVLRQLGGPDPHFETLAGASLELGHRWIRCGALMRHDAGLLPAQRPAAAPPDLPLNDEIRFLHLRYGRVWTAWACWRRRGEGLTEIIQAWRRRQPAAVASAAVGFHEPNDAVDQPGTSEAHPAVTVLIPTLDRYPHLFNVLDQLRRQTAPPLEIVVVDQSEGDGRDPGWPERFADLPLRVLWRDQAGQCSSRNAGLAAARGEAVLFLDDDDEVEPDLIARHLAFLRRFDADASCGVAEEAGAGALPSEFRLIRDSDVFPTNNSLLKIAALARSGLFDLAYEKGERADHDLGMRLYLSGATLVLNPAASVIHLHAPRGGLRQHKARVITRSSSRASVWHRQFLAPTEAYLWARYFDAGQVREALLIRTLGTLRGRGAGWRRWARAVVMLALLPDTWRQNSGRLAAGRAMLARFPSIPDYEPGVIKEPLTL